MAENRISNGIQAGGEKFRSSEFKTARDGLVKNINAWLDEQKLKFGDVEQENLVTETTLGPINSRVNMVGVSYREGTNMSGDGISSPLKFQRVSQEESGKLEVISVSGTDPVASAVRGNEYENGHRSEQVASFGVETYDLEGLNNYFRYDFKGDGSVSQHFVSAEGVHTGRALSTVQDIEMATLAFEQVATTITS
jgi:hypothetical protein